MHDANIHKGIAGGLGEEPAQLYSSYGGFLHGACVVLLSLIVVFFTSSVFFTQVQGILLHCIV